MRNICRSILAGGLLSLFFTAGALQAQPPGPKCSSTLANGTYEVNLYSTFDGANPFGLIGVLALDGAGGGTAVGTVNINGGLAPFSYPVTFTTNANCTGTMAFGDVTFASTITPDGATIAVMLDTSTLSLVLSGKAVWVAPNPAAKCGAALADHNYQVNLSGNAAGGVPVGLIGLLALDGAGGGTFVGSINDNGAVSAVGPAAVTFTTNANCTGTMSIPTAESTLFAYDITPSGGTIYLLQTDSGNPVVLSGSAVQVGP
jgi:hypothetical protein